MNALLLAAGLGTRLRPITNTVPKCLVPIRGKPLLGYWLDLLASAGFERILINLHHLPDLVRGFVEASPHRDRVVLVHEETLLGTGGTLLARRNDFEKGSFLVVHADNLSRFDVGHMQLRHRERPHRCIATMMTFETDTPRSCGIVTTDAFGVVTSYVEKPERPVGNLANGAVYLFEPEILDLLADLGKKVIDLSTDVLPLLIGRMATFKNDVYHRDIGTSYAYERAQSETRYLTDIGTAREPRSMDDCGTEDVAVEKLGRKACVVCGKSPLADLGSVGVRSSSVLSDVRLCPRSSRIHVCTVCGHLQKVYGTEDLAAINETYASYQAYPLAQGMEQPAFEPGRAPTARSRIALEKCRDLLPFRGRLLDFGCANGAMLKSASQVLEGWELHGSDLNDRFRKDILAIPGVAGFHSGTETFPSAGPFDLVVLWHVLEHLDEPVGAMKRIRGLLGHGGRLLVSVPDVERAPFDLAVLDHVSHFSWTSLVQLLLRAGFDVELDGREWIYNALTVLCVARRDDRVLVPGEQPFSGRNPVSSLNEIVCQFEARAAKGPYALFGTGNSSLFLLGQLSRSPEFLLDEDRAKAGRMFDGIPIRNPDDVDLPLDVLVPLHGDTARKIVTRLRNRSALWAARHYELPERS